MRLRDFIIPDEVQSASAAATGMLGIVTRTSHFWLKQCFAAILPVALGFGLGWLLSGALAGREESIIRGVVAAVLTLASVLAGFMVTLMLFTGRTTGASSLPFEQAEEYVAKVKYLLFSQAVTPIVHLLLIAFCIAWLIADAVGAALLIDKILLGASSGVLLLALIRTLLLPFQIYEIHEFELDSMVDEKKDNIRKALREQYDRKE